MKYSGIDPHSNNSVVAVVIDKANRVVHDRRLPNKPASIVGVLARLGRRRGGSN